MQWKSNKYYVFWVCVCSLMYPACNVNGPSVACPILQYFSMLSHKQHDFRKTVFEPKMCVLIFSTTLSETFIVLRRIEWDIVKNSCLSSCKVHVILIIFQWNMNFLDITCVVQQDTQLLLWLHNYLQYVWQLDMFRTYRSIFRSIYKLCVAGLVCEDYVLLGAYIR